MKTAIIASLALPALVAGDDAEETAAVEEFSVPDTTGASFVETFQTDPFEAGRWTKSTDASYDGQEWSFGAPDGVEGKYKDDTGITVAKEAKRYGISTKLDSPVTSENKDLVLQYEVRLQEGLQCGGAYLKFLTGESDELTEKSGYSVMFGPDKCGGTNQVHLILRHQNPVSGKWEEKHLKSSPSPKTDKAAHLYTAILRQDKTFEILIDSVSVKSGTISDEMVAFVDGKKKDYGFTPPEMIDDPEDSKPEDWVDEAKIKDPDASKPEDWDEDAPKKIPDMDAEKPEDWLDDEPDFVPDPDAEMPEDWDEEEDGDWEAPQVANPKCAASSGCGEWVRPIIDNPDYRGKWVHPMIDNPDYIGEWSPRQIDNPEYFSEETHPEAFKTLVAPIEGVAVEIWTMQKGIHFDNVYIGNDIGAAAEWARASFGVEQEEEAAAAKAAKRKAAAEARKKKWEEGGVLAKFSVLVSSFLEFAGDNLIATICTFVLLFGSFCWWMCCRDDEEMEYASYADEDDDIEEEEDDENEEEGEPVVEDKKEKTKDVKEKTDSEPVPQSSVPASDAKDAAAAESAAKATGKKKKNKKKKKKKSAHVE
jgi:calnexin